MAWRCFIGRHYPGPARLDPHGSAWAVCVECTQPVAVRAQLAPNPTLTGRLEAARALVGTDGPLPHWGAPTYPSASAISSQLQRIEAATLDTAGEEEYALVAARALKRNRRARRRMAEVPQGRTRLQMSHN